MATKFLKSQNGGIYKDSTGKPIAVEPERVIRGIDGSIPASSLEDISVSTETASNGVTYIRAQMKGKVNYTDNTTDTIQYDIDLPIKAGDGITIEAQPLAGGTRNQQLVISASGGGGATLNKYTVRAQYDGKNERALIYRILQNSKSASIYEEMVRGPVTFCIDRYGYLRWSAIGSYTSGVKNFVYLSWDSSGALERSTEYDYRFVVADEQTGEITVKRDIFYLNQSSYLDITYYNETEIT